MAKNGGSEDYSSGSSPDREECVQVIEGLVLRQMGVAWGTKDDSSSASSDDSVRLPCSSSKAKQEATKVTKNVPSCAEPSEVVPMTVDTCEDLWTRLHDVRINGCLLEYIGRGKSIYDNGLAQSNTPLTPLSHYFEVKIVNPGENCYIAIGLARKDYPLHKHPGWNRGSIAYHADDGKIFIGSGVGTPFGPRCVPNDILGCGIVFPSKMNLGNSGGKKGKVEWPWDVDSRPAIRKISRSGKGASRALQYMDNVMDASSESEDDIWWNNRNQVYEDKVQVFFMRNGKLLGMKDIRIPKGGFYPTIGMMSQNEKVMIDMNPLSG